MTRTLCLALTLGVVLSAAPPPDAAGLLGFHESRVAEQLAREKSFDAQLRAGNLRAWMKRLSARPHAVGSPYGKEVAAFIAGKFNEWGFETEIETYYVLLPTPKSRLLELIAPRRFTASLQEPALTEDSTSGQTAEQLPTYNAFSIDGDVTAEVVYVNRGLHADYEALERRGIDVKGKIVIARYGGSWRGIKPKIAAEKGAIGCIIYSDPRDDGYFQGDVYPKGPYRNRFGVQRGSVIDGPLYPGDPLTPNIGATKDAKRLEIKDAPTITKIPVLPISYSDAQPILAALEGPVAPPNFRGALPITYHLGPGPARVRLKLEFNWDLVPAYDVIARLRGGERPEEWIIRGNHHDAWVNGAQDPISGLVALMEEARAVSTLTKSDWRPKRTIVYTVWDAEEPMLLGSTEWAEDHAAELREHAVAYLNTDGNGRGFLHVGGSHTLEKLVNQVAGDVPDPQKGVSVAERLRARTLISGSPEQRKEVENRADLRISSLGSGSDYTPFLQHLGIASLNLSYGGEGGGGSYHSIYDSFDHYTRFNDSDFSYGVTLAKTAGRLTLRLADADCLPFELRGFADNIALYVRQVKELAGTMRTETERRNRLIREGIFELAADSKKTLHPPAPKGPVPYLNFAPLDNAMARLKESAAGFEQARKEFRRSGKTLPLEAARKLDVLLYQSERRLTDDAGLPRRPWYKHQIYAPGFYTGYGVKTLPGVREAIEQREWDIAEQQIERAARVLTSFADQITQAATLLREAAGD